MPIPDADSVALNQNVITDLSGGMVTNYNYTKIQKNQVIRLLNGDLYEDGTVNTRLGRVKLIEDPFSGNPTVNAMFAIGQSSGGDLILAKASTILAECSTGTKITVKTGLTSGAILRTTVFDNYAFCVDGIDTPFITQGAAATTYQMGISPPTDLTGFTLTPTAGGDGTDGTHLLTFRYRSTITGARSNPFISGTTIQAGSITLGGGNNTYQITFPVGLVSGDPQVTTIDYFVQLAGAPSADSPYYFLGSSANAAGTYSFGSLVADDDLIVLETLDVDDDVAPSSLRDVEQWRGRIIGILDDYHVNFSKQRIDGNGFVNLPTSWPADNQLEVGYGDGDPLQKVINFQDYIFAFKRRSVWFLNGDFSSSDFGFVKLKVNHANIGAINVSSVVVAGDRVFFVTDDLKFYYFRITDFSTEQLRISEVPPSQAVADVFSTFASAYRQNINVLNYSFNVFNQIWINFSSGASGLSSGNNFNTFVYDFVVNEAQGSWGINTGNEIASSVLARDNDGNYNVYSGDYYGFVWKHGVGTGDGATINGTSTGLNTVSTFNDTTASFTSALIGTFISITGFTDAAQGQIRRITGVPSATQVSVTPDWDTVPTNMSPYTIGGIDFQIWSRYDWCDDTGPPYFQKLGWYLDIDFDTEGDYAFTTYLLTNRSTDLTLAKIVDVSGTPGALWGTAIWGFDKWAAPTVNLGQIGMNLYFKTISHRIINQQAGQPLTINGWTYTYQTLDWDRTS